MLKMSRDEARAVLDSEIWAVQEDLETAEEADLCEAHIAHLKRLEAALQVAITALAEN